MIKKIKKILLHTAFFRSSIKFKFYYKNKTIDGIKTLFDAVTIIVQLTDFFKWDMLISF